VLAAGNGTTDRLTGLTGWAAELMTNLLSAPGGAQSWLDNLFPPIPSEVVLPAGFLAAQGR